MPTIGWFEILVIVAVSIVVIGPKDFPYMLKKVGSWIASAKKYIANIQNEVSDIDLDKYDTQNHKDKKKNDDKI
jgi:sec-independent protein translocase protein TatB